MSDYSISRRGLLAGAAAMATMSAMPSARASTPAVSGLQLYTIRSEMQKDVPGSLKKIADADYKEVEFAGYFGHTPAEIRKMVADLGMTAPSAHLQDVGFIDNPQKTIDEALAAGHQFLVLPWVKPELRATIDQWKGVAGMCNTFGAKCKAAGLRFAYHNHNFEFEPIGGVVPYDVMLANTDPSVVQFELDMYWCQKGGADIVKVLTAHRGRFPMCHVKDMLPNGEMTDVGLGTIDFAAIFANPAVAPFEHYFVENDDTKTPFESAAISARNLTKILAGLPAR